VLTTPNPSYWRTKLFRIQISGGAHLHVYDPEERMDQSEPIRIALPHPVTCFL